MKPVGYSPVNRFDPEALFRPKTVVLSGGATALGARLRETLASAPFEGGIAETIGKTPSIDLALIADPPERVPAILARLSGKLRGAAIVYSDPPGLRAAAIAARVRVIGPHSFGLAVPGLGLNALLAHIAPKPGRVALLGQSPALARAVIDWAEPNGIGFSHIVGIGGNADIGFGRVLDHLARDPGTGPILLEIAGLRDPRLFLSAARAAARLRPIVALAPGARLADPSFTALAAFEAALARAGVLLTTSLGEFFAAAETLTRARPARGDRLAILGNSRGGCLLAADAALAAGVALATLAPETRRVLGMMIGAEPAPDAPIALPGAPGTKLADIAAMLAAAPEVGGVLVIHAPSGPADDAAIAGLIACAGAIKAPLLAAIPGETTGTAQRLRLAEAGVAAFATPEDAVSGFADLLRHRRIRAAARELPQSAVLDMAPDRESVAAVLASARAEDRATLTQAEAFAVLRAYGIEVLDSRIAATQDEVAEAAAAIGFPVVVKLSHPDLATARPEGSVALDLPDAASARAAAGMITARLRSRGEWPEDANFLVQRQIRRARELRIRVAEHIIVGPTIGFGPGGGDLGEVGRLAVDLPPLNLALANALVERAGAASILRLARGLGEAHRGAVEATLVRVSQLIVDWPDIAALDIDPLFATEHGASAASARITLRPAGERRAELVIAPYPAELAEAVELRGKRFLIRPIRPEDAEAHHRLFERLTPADVRFRFFSAVRALTPEQVVRMTEVDYGREIALIGVDQATGETAGVARLVRSDTDGTEGEFAVLVENAAKGVGLGSALMHRLIVWARREGVAEIVGQVLAANTPMLAFVRKLGFAVRRLPGEDDVVEVRLPLA
ncbi:bifunctional acetate--CoA ligase family protein/GNAT family N-acetyltransferase [Acidiphilium iwatense]|uniref:GNAT family N-acetyltransferase n=1 Tax=Acidiphilium iwatense TaxID=768198 RepID=A0ABS9DT63_9PROT|nr:GNAT family N-acetyltransferase [Acidiphilium iwatense]MCF3945365.1 GNAT family N-acetyltransferase [Acidiphilium iwatense]